MDKGPSLSVFTVLSVLFTLSQFYRTSVAVISPSLMSEFGLGAEKLGILGASFFYAFSLLQIPMGILLDRIGPKKVMTVLPTIGAIGAFIFASAREFESLLIGRVLLGIGMSPALMGSFKVLTISFPAERFATFSGLLLSLGTLGNILASSPLAYLNSLLGWRKTFVLFGIATLFFSFLVWVVLDGILERREEKIDGVRWAKDALFSILKNLSFWQIATLAFFRYGTFVAMQGLWFGPYLICIKRFDPIMAGNIIMMLSFGIILGSPLAGYLSDRFFKSPKKTVLFGVSLYAFSILFFVGLFDLSDPLEFFIIFLLIGIFNGFGILVYAHAKSLFASEISGTVMSSVNLFTMAGGAFFMHVMGGVIDSLKDPYGSYPAEAYHRAFSICLIGLLLSLFFYSLSKEKKNHGY